MKNLTTCPHRGAKNRGVTLVEVMMVLGVMAFLLGLIMTIMSIVSDHRKNNELLQEIFIVKDATTSLTENANKTVENDDLAPVLYKAKAVPQKYFSSSEDLITPYGTQIKLYTNAWAVSGITLWLSSVPKTACMLLGAGGWGGNQSVNNIRINGLLTSSNISPQELAQNCTDSNAIAINFDDN